MPRVVVGTVDGVGSIHCDGKAVLGEEGTMSPLGEGEALGGVVRVQGAVYVLLIEEAEVTGVVGSHPLLTVRKARWVELPNTPPINLPMSHPPLLSVDPSHLHFYSTYDVSRPWPPSKGEDTSFVTNAWMVPHCLQDYCVRLVQGAALSHPIESSRTVTYITRRAVGNPGVRYHSRGLSRESHVANEVECELLVMDDTGSWSSSVWRRGTVPVRWCSRLALNSEGEEIEVLGGSADGYYKEVERRYGEVDVVHLSLLRKGESIEAPLGREFARAVGRRVLMEYDWHGEVARLGVQGTVEELWKLMKPYTDGVVRNSTTPLTRVWRFNCKDSLDRTNIATFFWGMQLLPQLVSYDPTWPLLGKSLSEVEQALPRGALAGLARMFVISGDVLSTLYTGTPASHSEGYRKYCPDGLASPPSFVGARRLWKHLMDDGNEAVHLWVGYDPRAVFRSSPHQFIPAGLRRPAECQSCRDMVLYYRTALCCRRCHYLVCSPCSADPACTTCGDTLQHPFPASAYSAQHERSAPPSFFAFLQSFLEWCSAA
eukprot:Sspe_Gene.79188::Locus_49611_Transcript_1_1_Confidence_1.000_Length_1673::g.79188::m.79188